MTQEISALMDGELEGREAEAALSACCGDEDRKRTWCLYHAIGDAMRGQAPASLEAPHQLFAKLREEPVVLAPRTAVPATAVRVALAAAASVATVGVVGWLGSQGGNPAAPAPVVAKSSTQSLQPVASTASVVIVPAPALSVQEYLVAHRQVPSPDLYRTVTHTAPAAAR